jgi:hypothetical protein
VDAVAQTPGGLAGWWMDALMLVARGRFAVVSSMEVVMRELR